MKRQHHGRVRCIAPELWNPQEFFLTITGTYGGLYAVLRGPAIDRYCERQDKITLETYVEIDAMGHVRRASDVREGVIEPIRKAFEALLAEYARSREPG